MHSTFSARWASMLWHAMATTGNGYHRPSLKRDGLGERRKDKVGLTKQARRYAVRYPSIGRRSK